MKYIDKKYGLGQTKDICNEKQKGGGDLKTVIYYYKVVVLLVIILMMIGKNLLKRKTGIVKKFNTLTISTQNTKNK